MSSIVALVGNNLPASAGHERDMGSVPWVGKPPGREHDSPFQYSRLGNPMDRGSGGLQLVGLQRVGHD